MTWVALSDTQGDCFSARGLGNKSDAPQLLDKGPDALIARGSLVFEMRLPATLSPVPLLIFDHPGSSPFYMSLQSIPGGGLNFVIRQSDTVLSKTLNHSDVGRTDIMRVTYAWDAPARKGRLSLERLETNKVLIAAIDAPKPMRVSDLRRLMKQGPNRYVAPELLFMALSDDVEPIGPMPSLTPDTPIATPDGYRPISEVRRGDLVITHEGWSVPVLHKLTRTVPARGAFRPVQLRAPYFGLLQDITIGLCQRILLHGTEVEYLFGKEEVLIQSGHLSGTHSALFPPCGPLVTYTQVLLPAHEAPLAAGCPMESLFIGRLRRDRDLLSACLLADADRKLLPEHAKPRCPALPAFDATVLAESRVAWAS